MLKYFSIILILSNLSLCINPGVVATVKKSIFDKVKHKFVPLIYEQIKNLDIKQEIEISKAKVHEIKVKIGPITPENIKLTEPDEKTITIEVTNFSMHLEAQATIHELITSSGTIKCDGAIEMISLNLVFKELDPKNPKPFINLSLEHYKIFLDKWHFALDFKYIPEFLIDLIINAFKRTIITDVLPVVTDVISSKTNEILDQNYPVFMNLENMDLAVATLMVEKPFFDEDNLVLKIDGTFFNEQKGYRRLGEPEFIGIRENSLGFNAFLSQYSLESFFDVVYNQDFHFKIQDYEIFFKTIPEKNPIVFMENILRIQDFHVEGGIKFNSYNLSFKTKVKSDFMIDSIDQESKRIHLEIIKFKFAQFEIDSNIPNLQFISPIIQKGLEFFLSWKRFFYVEVPLIKLPFDIELDNLGFNILDHSINLGIDFNFK